MGIPFIVLGDTTNKGGRVIEASMFTDTHGKGIARVGDRVTCHSGCRIATGDHTMLIDGAAAARHGDRTTCGAMLIASQSVTTDIAGGSAGAASAGALAAAAIATAAGSAAKDSVAAKLNRIAEDDPLRETMPDEQVRATDPRTGEPIPDLAYYIETPNGTAYTGFTDADGLCERVPTYTAREITVWFGEEAEEMRRGV